MTDNNSHIKASHKSSSKLFNFTNESLNMTQLIKLSNIVDGNVKHTNKKKKNIYSILNHDTIVQNESLLKKNSFEFTVSKNSKLQALQKHDFAFTLSKSDDEIDLKNVFENKLLFKKENETNTIIKVDRNSKSISKNSNSFSIISSNKSLNYPIIKSNTLMCMKAITLPKNELILKKINSVRNYSSQKIKDIFTHTLNNPSVSQESKINLINQQFIKIYMNNNKDCIEIIINGQKVKLNDNKTIINNNKNDVNIRNVPRKSLTSTHLNINYTQNIINNNNYNQVINNNNKREHKISKDSVFNSNILHLSNESFQGIKIKPLTHISPFVINNNQLHNIKNNKEDVTGKSNLKNINKHSNKDDKILNFPSEENMENTNLLDDNANAQEILNAKKFSKANNEILICEEEYDIKRSKNEEIDKKSKKIPEIFNKIKKNENEKKEIPPIPEKKFECKNLKKKLNFLIDNFAFIITITIMSIFVLLIDDIKLAAIPGSADYILDILKIICLVTFSFEAIFYCICKDGYLNSFLFWMDIISIASLLQDIEFIFDSFIILFDSKDDPNTDISKVNSFGKALSSSRYIRVIRMIRIIRLIRLVRLYKSALETKKRIEDYSKEILKRRIKKKDSKISNFYKLNKEEESFKYLKDTSMKKKVPF